MSTLERVVSGGQTGADRQALEAARTAGFATGGWAPAGFLTSEGEDWALGRRFGLRQMPRLPRVAEMYVERSKRNVECSDATLAFRQRPSPGTDKTLAYCATGHWGKRPAFAAVRKGPFRPSMVIEDVADQELAAHLIADFVRGHGVRTLNVCGHRSDARAGRPGYSRAVREIMALALAELKQKK